MEAEVHVEADSGNCTQVLGDGWEVGHKFGDLFKIQRKVGKIWETRVQQPLKGPSYRVCGYVFSMLVLRPDISTAGRAFASQETNLGSISSIP